MFVGTASFMKNVVCFAVVVPARSPVYGFTICFDESANLNGCASFSRWPLSSVHFGKHSSLVLRMSMNDSREWSSTYSWNVTLDPAVNPKSIHMRRHILVERLCEWSDNGRCLWFATVHAGQSGFSPDFAALSPSLFRNLSKLRWPYAMWAS